jgi:hypothetical protein
LLAAPVAVGQREPGDPIKLMIHPAAAPAPALKYQLLPDVRDLTPGNAALGYYRALSFRGEMPHAPGMGDKEYNWLSVPLKDFPREEARKFLHDYRHLLREVERAARCDRCDWQLLTRIREEGFQLLLPDVQQMRFIANLLALQARLEMAEGQLDKALATLQTGFTLAKHTGEIPLMISSLVGMALAGVMTEQLQSLLELPDAPNLYWSLTDLPRPFVDLRGPLQGERAWIETCCPGLRNPKTGPLPPQQVLAMIGQIGKFMGGYGGGPDSAELKLFAATASTLVYPDAKQFLLQHGWTAEQVEAMPVVQVGLTYAVYDYDRRLDDMIKWHGVPYWEASAGLAKVNQQLREAKVKAGGMQGIHTTLATLLLPAIDKVMQASARLDRRIAALRCIEAIRLHAAAHEGKLPARLGDITEVPVPVDPMTGKEFEYTVAGDKAMLHGPATDPGKSPHLSLKYELSLQRRK